METFTIRIDRKDLDKHIKSAENSLRRVKHEISKIEKHELGGDKARKELNALKTERTQAQNLVSFLNKMGEKKDANSLFTQ